MLGAPIAVRSVAAVRGRDLAYAQPDEGFVRRIRTARDGLLEELRQAGEALVMRYGWDEARARRSGC
jgi:hypothetical protein